MSQFNSIANYIIDFLPKHSVQICLNIIVCSFIHPISVAQVEVDILGYWRFLYCVLSKNNDDWCLIISCSLESLEKDEIISLPLTLNLQHKPYPAKPFMTNTPHSHSAHIHIHDNLNELLFFLPDQHYGL